jgi:hypothetical protein
MTRIILACVAAVPLLSVMLQSDEPPRVPPNHPTVTPSLPAGHPTTVPAVPDQPLPAVEAQAEDVATIDAVIATYYASLSGPKGQARDWDRYRSLFIPDARCVMIRPGPNGIVPIALTPDQFVTANGTYLENGGYFGVEIHRIQHPFGHIAQVLSTYESKRDLNAPPYSRGINSFQLLYKDGRWWIVSVLWEHEMPHTNPLPPEYLPE